MPDLIESLNYNIKDYVSKIDSDDKNDLIFNIHDEETARAEKEFEDSNEKLLNVSLRPLTIRPIKNNRTK